MFIGRQRLRHDLVHVVVLVGRQPADEVDAGRPLGEGLVLLVALGVLGAGDGVVGVAFGPRVLVDDGGLGVLLTGQVLELGDPGVLVVVREVDGADRLEARRVVGLEAEVERAVGQLAVGVVEVASTGPV